MTPSPTLPANTATAPFTEPSRPAIHGGPERLSADARRAIMALTGARPVRFAATLVLTWLTIAALICLGVYADHIAVTALCIFFIGTRQMSLALLLHEQVHRLGMRSKYADWIVNLCAVYPLFVTTVEDYAKVHLSHHKYCFTKNDPDFLRKAGAEWSFPKSPAQLFILVLRDVTAMNVLRLIRGKTAPRTTEFTRRHPTPKALRLAFFAALLVLLTVSGGWTVFLVYWLLPTLTVTQVMVRWIAVCEHEYNIENGTIHETTPLIILNWWQRALMPDLNFGYHAYHHMHPGVSFSLLPQVHAIYQREALVDNSAIFFGQWAYLMHLSGRRVLPASPSAVTQK